MSGNGRAMKHLSSILILLGALAGTPSATAQPATASLTQCKSMAALLTHYQVHDNAPTLSKLMVQWADDACLDRRDEAVVQLQLVWSRAQFEPTALPR
jgi:hypothetical protein